ncbi:hypothetical protein IF2G_04827 [Cordyceps javanica]|nr:hypothetical protein IF2G_04827 [Cordyceps javanica]
MSTCSTTEFLVIDELAWDDGMSKYLTDCDTLTNPKIGERATITDACRHSTCLAQASAVFCGPAHLLSIKGEDHLALTCQYATYYFS